MRSIRLCWLLIALWSLQVTLAFAEIAIPELESRVIDQVGLLTSTQRQQLEQQLAGFEKSKGSQIAILIVSTTKPETIDQYSFRVAEAWQLGRKDIDDGLLLLVAVQDRSMRIEVGYGLEGAIPDAIAKRVIAEIITPHFKQEQYYQGIVAGVQRLIGLVDGEPLPVPNSDAKSDPGSMLMIVVFALFMGGNFINAIFGRLLGAGVTSTIVTGLIWILMGSLLTAILIGIGVFIFSLLRPGMNGVSSGRHRDDGFGGGGFGGGGFGGGGFGGGGGGFGGGGASGGW